MTSETTITTHEPNDAPLGDLAQQISGAWARGAWPGLRRLNVEARTNSIRITGNVNTFTEKQQAYHWARRLAGGLLVEEEIQVLVRHA